MSIPPESIARGAQRWLELVPDAGVQRTRALLTSSRAYSDLTPTQYEESLEWVRRSGLLEKAASRPTPQALFEALIVSGSPSWLKDADVLVQDVSEIPGDAWGVAETLGIGPQDALSCIRRAWGKVDTAIRNEVGDSGEREVLNLLEVKHGVSVDHIASWSDSHGYDISVHARSRACHLEVKATTRSNMLRFYLSRNEYETMRTDPWWVLALVILDENYRLSRVYAVARSWVQLVAPGDTRQGANWESAKFQVPSFACESGVSALEPFLADPMSPLLTGKVDAPRISTEL